MYFKSNGKWRHASEAEGLVIAAPVVVLEEVKGAGLGIDVEGVCIAVRLEREAQLPAVEIARNADIRVRELFGFEIITNIAETQMPVRRNLHAADEIDRMRGDDRGIADHAVAARDMKFVADRKIAQQVDKCITRVIGLGRW